MGDGYSCDTVERNRVTGLWNIFAGLHIYCGAWETMWDGWTSDECGEDVGDNLIHGDTVVFMAQVTLQHKLERQAYVFAVSATEKPYLPLCQCGDDGVATTRR